MDKQTKQGETLSSEHVQNVEELLQRMGQLLNNAALYGPLHNLTRQSMTDTYTYMISVLEGIKRINISITDDKLFIDGTHLESSNSFVTIFVTKLADLNISGFSLMHGMPKDEFIKLIGLILSDLEVGGEQKDFAILVQEMNLSYIHSEKVSYQRVTDGDIVVAADETLQNKEEEEEEEESLIEIVPATTEPEPEEKVFEIQEVEATPPPQSISQIMAFLKGDAGTENLSEELAEVANDAEKLAQLIMEATAIRQKNMAIDEGESLGDLLVGCLRRTFEGLMSNPSTKTQAGKKSLKKTMLLLEKTVLEKLQNMAGDATPDVQTMIADEFETMIDEVEIDSLATEYMRRRRSMEKTEKRMMRYMRSKAEAGLSDETLQQHLYDEGMTPSGWQALSVKNNEQQSPGDGAGGEQGGSGGIGALAVLLAELDDLMSARSSDSDVIGNKASDIAQEVDRIAEGTEEKIEALGSEFDQIKEMLVGADEFEASQKNMPQHEFRELLAEIVQELCQPLSATNCAVNMTLEGHVGDLNNKQHEVLSVASKCGHRLDKLLEHLKNIVGMPSGLKPDKEKIYNLSSCQITGDSSS